MVSSYPLLVALVRNPKVPSAYLRCVRQDVNADSLSMRNER